MSSGAKYPRVEIRSFVVLNCSVAMNNDAGQNVGYLFL